MKSIKKAWNGKERLTTVFWGYYFIGLLIFIITAGILVSFASSINSDIILYPLAPFLIVYMVWVHWSLWSCAFNVNNRVWGYLVRTLVIVTIFGKVLKIIM